MKAVLMSIQPKWCELIASGEKTVELRKTQPKLAPPFTVYIYCTKNKEKLIDVIHDGDDMGGFIHRGKPNFIKTYDKDWSIYGTFNGGKVIGEFVCEDITDYNPEPECGGRSYFISDDDFERTCLTLFDELVEYGKGATVYGWHISNLIIYDKPRELSEFTAPEWFRDCEKQCDDMERWRCPTKDSRKVDKMCGWCRRGGNPITRPPQSWCYVEEQK